MNGLLVLDKPGGITSRDAVNQIQQRLPPRMKIGHTGTLDPLATGVLVLCIGQATRLAQYVQERPKTYQSTWILGARSDTDDADGRVEEVDGVVPVSRELLEPALLGFHGEIEQVPPAYSAAHVDGQRAYARARAGKEIYLDPRRVRVDRIEILRYAWPQLEVQIDCSKGTYIRSLARDLGEKLGCGAYVQKLRRLRVGSFTVEQAMPLTATWDPSKLLPMSAAVDHLPAVSINQEVLRRLVFGQELAVDLPATCRPGGECALLDARGQLVGIGLCLAGGRIHGSKMLVGSKG